MNFDTAIDRVLTNEGGYTPGVGDPGGETNFGIGKRSYPDVDIKNLTREQAIEIYRRDFWAKVDGADLPDDVMFQALDFAVNSGCETAIRYLQRAAGVADDGHIGPVTIDALKAMPPAVLLIIYLALRLKFMRGLKNWPIAGGTWANRIADDMILGAQDLLPQ